MYQILLPFNLGFFDKHKKSRFALPSEKAQKIDLVDLGAWVEVRIWPVILQESQLWL